MIKIIFVITFLELTSLKFIFLTFKQYFTVDNKPALDDLIDKARESGITWNDEIDEDKLGEALLDAFVPNIVSFIPSKK